MEERELIPFEATRLLGEKVLVLAPHPDDEILGCGGVIALNAQSGRSVTVVVVTDGTAAEPGVDTTEYRERRERESAEGLADLGVTSAPRFLRFADRSLGEDRAALTAALRELLLEFTPDLVLAPSPVETHPDHSAVAGALLDLVHSDSSLGAFLDLTTIAFYEVSQPFRPNTLVDISSVASLKDQAISRHASQESLRDYGRFMRGLNEYRTMSLGPETKAAEAYSVMRAGELRLMPFSAIVAGMLPKARISAGAPDSGLGVTVVIRTRDRHAWLREAVQSVLDNDLEASIVVVNDGGASPAAWLQPMSDTIRIIEHAESKGRSEAMNVGVRAATTEWVGFLDDDDLYFPEHLSTLTAAARSSVCPVYYSDAVMVPYERSETGMWQRGTPQRLFQQDFDPALLLVDNYIPLTTLLLRRDDYLAAGGFDPEFELFEDWDFLIRLSQGRRFQRVPRVTCEVRHFPTSGSLVVSAPVGSESYRVARRKIWDKHGSKIGFDVFETLKEQLVGNRTRAIDAEGVGTHVKLDVARLEREKQQLIEEVGAKHQLWQQELAHRGAVEAELRVATAGISELRRFVDDLRERLDKAEQQIQAVIEERDSLRSAHESLQREHESLRIENAERAGRIHSLFGEIARLNGLLDQIYRSRTWKAHELLERIKGRK